MIHDTAIVHPGARIADGVEIGPYTIVGDRVEIAAGCRVGPHVTLYGPTSLGPGNRIFQYCSIGEEPQDLKYAGEPTQLLIGQGNVFREYCTINRGTVGGGGITRIGDNNLFMAYIHVAHDCVIANNTIFSNCAQLAGHVEVGDFVILGGFTTVHQFTRLGEHCFTGLSSVVNRDVPPFSIVSGNHAKAYGINKEGLRRRGFDASTIAALHSAFKTLVYARGPRSEAHAAVVELRARFPEVDRFASFIESSRRGIVR